MKNSRIIRAYERALDTRSCPYSKRSDGRSKIDVEEELNFQRGEFEKLEKSASDRSFEPPPAQRVFRHKVTGKESCRPSDKKLWRPIDQTTWYHAIVATYWLIDLEDNITLDPSLYCRKRALQSDEVGVRHAIRIVREAREEKKFVLKMDIANYFDSISVDILMEDLRRHGYSEDVASFLIRLVTPPYMEGGRLKHRKTGISQGISLSAFLSNLYLQSVITEIKSLYGEDLILVQYVDDTFVCHEDESVLRGVLRHFESRIEERSLRLKQGSHVYPCTQDIVVLGERLQSKINFDS